MYKLFLNCCIGSLNIFVMSLIPILIFVNQRNQVQISYMLIDTLIRLGFGIILETIVWVEFFLFKKPFLHSPQSQFLQLILIGFTGAISNCALIVASMYIHPILVICIFTIGALISTISRFTINNAYVVTLLIISICGIIMTGIAEMVNNPLMETHSNPGVGILIGVCGTICESLQFIGFEKYMRVYKNFTILLQLEATGRIWLSLALFGAIGYILLQLTGLTDIWFISNATVGSIVIFVIIYAIKIATLFFGIYRLTTSFMLSLNGFIILMVIVLSSIWIESSRISVTTAIHMANICLWIPFVYLLSKTVNSKTTVHNTTTEQSYHDLICLEVHIHKTLDDNKSVDGRLLLVI